MPFCAPQIVCSQSFIGETSNIAATVVFTAPSKGLYRFQFGGNIVPSGGSASLTFLLEAPGSIGAIIDQSMSQGVGSVTPFVSLIPSGTEFTLSTTNSGSFSTFDLYLVIEQLA